MKRKVDVNELIERIKQDVDKIDMDALCGLVEYFYPCSNVVYDSLNDVVTYETIEDFDHVDDFKEISETNE